MELETIKNISVFRGLNEKDLAEVAKICHLEEVKKGREIFKAGDSRQEFIVILEGKLRVARKIKEEKETLAYMDKDNFAVESALVDPKLKHTHYGDIVEEGKILKIKGRDFISLARKNAVLANQIYGNIIKNITERLHHANNKLVTVYSTGKIASTYANVYNLLSLILETILTVIRANKALFALYKPLQNKIVIQEAIGYASNQKIKNLEIKINSDPFLGKIYQTGQDLFITPEDYKANKNYNLPYLSETALGVKVQTGNKILGAIVLTDKRKENFNFNNQILLNIISRQVASAIKEAEKTEEKGLGEELGREYIKPI